MPEDFWRAVTALSGAAAVIIGAVIAYAGVTSANALKKLEQETRNRELVKSCLEFLTGGTQNRTVGIALLKDRVDDGSISRVTARSILEGQAEHLKDSKNEDAKRPIEQHNLRTINQLLAEWSKPISGPASLR
ncbi:MAG TPA: hypothetical protein VGI20_02325 [Rhizomicrobium sp.]